MRAERGDPALLACFLLDAKSYAAVTVCGTELRGRTVRQHGRLSETVCSGMLLFLVMDNGT